MEATLIETVLEGSEDFESVIRGLSKLCLGFEDTRITTTPTTPETNVCGGSTSSESLDVVASNITLPNNDAEWIEVFVNEVISSPSMDEAKFRVSRALEVFKNSTRTEAAEKRALIMENTVLKRAFAILYRRRKKESDEQQQLKQLLTQYQERLNRLELTNYALKMQLRQTDQNNSSIIPVHYTPDVF